VSIFKRSYDLVFKYNEEEVLATVDCRKEDPNYSEYQKEFIKIVEESKSYIHPKGYVIIEEGDTHLPEPALMTVYCLVSLGEGIDQEVTDKFKDHEYLGGMMLNALADQVLFKASNQLFEYIKEEQELYLTNRYEPGNSQVPMEKQKIILDKITEVFPVKIVTTEAFMLSPTKSLTYFYGLEETACGLGLDHVCSSCDLVDCERRHYIIEVDKGQEKEVIQAQKGTNLLDILRQHDIFVEAPCSGKGLCGKCKVHVQAHGYQLEEKEKAFLSEAEVKSDVILACYHTLDQDLKIHIKPIMDEATIEADYMAFTVKKSKYQPVEGRELLGIAVDIGTTTVVVQLIDLLTGAMKGIRKYINPQKAYGADVISRIMYVGENEDQPLGDLIRESIENAVLELVEEQGLESSMIEELAISGNTTMAYLLLDMDPKALAVSPFTTADMGLYTCDAKEIFTRLKDIRVTVLPYISAYVGGDIVSGLFATHLIDKKENIIFVDIGTNGEMVLRTKDRLISAATAAGPAFEGANIKCGMGSLGSAICEITAADEGYEIVTIDGGKAEGICGSALIDGVALLHKQGYIDDSGFMENPVMIQGDIGIYPEDIRQVQLAKAAIMAGVDTLLKEADLTYDDIDAFYLAGGFGSHLNKENSAYIGLIPKEIVDKVNVVGNTSLAGSVRYLLEKEGKEEIEALRKKCEYIELSTNISFNNSYIMEMTFGDKL